MYEFVYSDKYGNCVRYARTITEFLRCCHDAAYYAIQNEDAKKYRAQCIQIFKINNMHKVAKYYEVAANAETTSLAMCSVIRSVICDELGWDTTVTASKESYQIITDQKTGIEKVNGHKFAYALCTDDKGIIVVGFNSAIDPDKAKTFIISHDGITDAAIDMMKLVKF